MPVTRRQAATDAQFSYSALDSSITTSFRIITVLSGRPHTLISCKLSHEDWQNTVHPYEAISYCWGDLSHTKPIQIDGRTFPITLNLESALKHLRYGQPEQRRRLWVDAICINQADKHERSHQVRQMFYIYNRASEVIVWLGDQNRDSHQALKFISSSLRPCFESVGFSCTDEQANVKSGFWIAFDEGGDDKCRNAIESLTTSKHARSWSSIARLLCRPWWARAWTVQELISAQKATVLCGTLSVPWPLIDVKLQMMLRNTTVEELYSNRSRDRYRDAVEDAFSFAYNAAHVSWMDQTPSTLSCLCRLLGIVVVKIFETRSSLSCLCYPTGFNLRTIPTISNRLRLLTRIQCEATFNMLTTSISYPRIAFRRRLAFIICLLGSRIGEVPSKCHTWEVILPMTQRIRLRIRRLSSICNLLS